MDTVRCFIALEMPEQVRDFLAEVQASIRAEMARADPSRSSNHAIKWADPSGVHLTLKFLGYVPAVRIGAIEDALQAATRAHSLFSVRLGGLGAFPNPQRVRVMWVGLEGDTEQLLSLQQSVEAEMARLGYPPEARAFSPHLTLARVRDDASPAQRRQLGEVLTRLPRPRPIAFQVDAISLMQSHLSPAGATYSRLAKLPLSSASEV